MGGTGEQPTIWVVYEPALLLGGECSIAFKQGGEGDLFFLGRLECATALYPYVILNE